MESSVVTSSTAADLLAPPGRKSAAASLVDDLVAEGVDLVVGVPCSHLHAVILELDGRHDIAYRPATNEGEAVALAVGWRLAGGSPVVMMQNSGLGNAVNPITSLSRTLDVPFLMLISWRGEPGVPDEPQHEVMGRITPDLLDLMGINHKILPSDEVDRSTSIRAAFRTIGETGRPYAFIVRKGIFQRPVQQLDRFHHGMPLREEAIREVVRAAGRDDLIVSTTGFTSRELEAQHDSPRNLYIVGSMGCASSVALGVAERAKGRRTIVLDGDGAALMRLEAMVSIGRSTSASIVHIVLDNTSYESTGGQPSGSESVDFPAVARACGYRFAASVRTASDIHDLLAGPVTGGPMLVHLPIAEGAPSDLGRPAAKPPANAARFAEQVERS